MVEQGLAVKLVSSPKPPEVGAKRARLYGSLTASSIIAGGSFRWMKLISVSKA
jgi:hypothetical protein